MPPISTKAPKLVKDLTVPVYSLPTSAVDQNSSSCFATISSETDLIEPTIFLLLGLNSKMVAGLYTEGS